MREVSGWHENDSKDNALATAAHAAESGKTHYLAGFSASYSVAGIGLVQIKDGSTVIFEHYIHNSDVHPFPHPIRITRGNAVSAELAASGTATEIGKVNIWGTTESN